MFPRFLLALFALVLLAAVACGQVVEEVEEVEVDESNDPRGALSIALKLIQAAFKWAAKNCLKEAAEHCLEHWNNPNALLECAKDFFAKNKGRCVVG